MRQLRKLNSGFKKPCKELTGVCFAVIILILLNNSVIAQGSFGARAFSLGGSTAALTQSGGWSLFHNPALLKTDLPGVSFYTMRFAGLEEITDMAAVALFRTRVGTAAAGAHRYGFELFQRTRLSTGLSRSAGRIYYGVNISLHHIAQGGGYGSASAVGVDAGVAAEIIPQLLLGSRITNVNRPTYGRGEEELPMEMAVGLLYNASNEFNLTADLVKDVRFPVSFRSGAELNLSDTLLARAGISARPNIWSAGLGYLAESYSFNLAIQRHEFLGISPAVDFTVRL